MNLGVLLAEFAWDIVALTAGILLLLLVVRLVPRQFATLRLKVLPSVLGILTALAVWLVGPR